MKTITVLPFNEIKFVKIISFEIEVDGELCPALIVYKRSLSKKYKMEYSNLSRSNRRLYYITEECYPRDEADDIIFDVIKRMYPNASISTSLLLFNTEKESLERYLSTYSMQSFKIIFLPRINDFESLEKFVKNAVTVFEKELSLYLHIRELNKEHFYASSKIYYNMENEDKMKDLESKLLQDVQ